MFLFIHHTSRMARELQAWGALAAQQVALGAVFPSQLNVATEPATPLCRGLTCHWAPPQAASGASPAASTRGRHPITGPRAAREAPAPLKPSQPTDFQGMQPTPQAAASQGGAQGRGQGRGQGPRHAGSASGRGGAGRCSNPRPPWRPGREAGVELGWARTWATRGPRALGAHPVRCTGGRQCTHGNLGAVSNRMRIMRMCETGVRNYLLRLFQ